MEDNLLENFISVTLERVMSSDLFFAFRLKDLSNVPIGSVEFFDIVAKHLVGLGYTKIDFEETIMEMIEDEEE